MSIKDIARNQQQVLINKAAKVASDLPDAQAGWIATVRSSLGMTAAQLSRRLGVNRAYVSAAEDAEINGTLTVKRLQRMAEAMGCRFVYCIVPEGDVQDLIEKQARAKATALVMRASKQMALENQMLSPEQTKYEIERLTKELLQKMPSDFWEENPK